MTDHIKLSPATGTWVVRAGGAVLGETKNAIEMLEGDIRPVIYIPREDIAMAFLDQTETTSHCPHKGDAVYFSIIAKSGEIKDAAWSYEDPKAELATIKGHLAFYTDRVAVEEV